MYEPCRDRVAVEIPNRRKPKAPIPMTLVETRRFRSLRGFERNGDVSTAMQRMRNWEHIAASPTAQKLPTQRMRQSCSCRMGSKRKAYGMPMQRQQAERQ